MAIGIFKHIKKIDDKINNFFKNLVGLYNKNDVVGQITDAVASQNNSSTDAGKAVEGFMKHGFESVVKSMPEKSVYKHVNGNGVGATVVDDIFEFGDQIAGAIKGQNIKSDSVFAKQVTKAAAKEVEYVHGQGLASSDLNEFVSDYAKKHNTVFHKAERFCMASPKVSIGAGAVLGLGGLWYAVKGFGQKQTYDKDTNQVVEKSLMDRVGQAAMGVLALGLGIAVARAGYQGHRL